MAAAFLKQRLDLVLSLEAEGETQLEFHPLFTDELYFLVSSRHPWARAGEVQRAEIARQHYILYHKHGITFRLVENYFRREDVVLNTVLEVGGMEATKELVKLGLGVSILAPWIVQGLRGRLARGPAARTKKLEWRWGVIHWRGKRPNPTEETVVGLCKSTSATLRLSDPAAA